MDAKQAILANMGQSDFLVEKYLSDLTSEELLARATPAANHIAWQLGHLIVSDRWILEKCAPGAAPELPDGFVERHSKATAASNDPKDFLSKDEYLRIRGEVRAAARRVVESLQPDDFDRPVTGVPPFVKTVGDALLLLGNHWSMHAGQWVVIRRVLGRPPLF